MSAPLSGADFFGAYAGRRVLVTGHTGFKGSWLSLWLRQLGAEVIGVSLDPPTTPSHYAACGMAGQLADLRCDVRDYARLAGILAAEAPEMVFHLAAQPLVRRAFVDPRETFEVNVMGTVNVLEAARRTPSVRAALVATSDKCYRNVGWEWAYRETDPLGGHEPYAGSKACAELVAEVYRDERFQRHAEAPRGFAVASARAGNVIGGGDWAADRLVPDIVRAIAAGEEIVVRNPEATRPWQHVLDCLSGYLHLGARLLTEPGTAEEGWNFGPRELVPLPAAALVRLVLDRWPGHSTRLVIRRDPAGKEAQVLRVDSSKAVHRLGWRSAWEAEAALGATIDWYRAHLAGGTEMRDFSIAQIAGYTAAARAAGAGWAVA
ncbi:CDP-glucose 4,6-dehydratase [Roseomonas sp. OT10]|uniref:CDP-glucose 4,6-dehydratase n=1 Tax=Roseomonas cutis TaxID=2897332 RepID=UPI001E3B52F8|nr:CDP-glucose 4,6-dehydratase [Roseomonas sp. OT10]UFN49761.1 CDP-glucose 4,6-dehydratase [Roseomonas sp. OT10]